MSVTVRTAPPEHWSWFVKRHSIGITQQFIALEAIDENDNIKGMIAFDNFSPNAVEFHFSAEGIEAVRALRKYAFVLPFEAFKRDVVYAFAPEKKRAHVLRISRKFGFSEVGRLKDGWAKGEDLLLLALRREDWELRSARRR